MTVLQTRFGSAGMTSCSDRVMQSADRISQCCGNADDTKIAYHAANAKKTHSKALAQRKHGIAFQVRMA